VLNGGGDTGRIGTYRGRRMPLAYDLDTQSEATNRTYARPVYTALDASHPFAQISNGFAGSASDGLTQLDQRHSLTGLYPKAMDGNLVQTVEISRTSRPFDLALGFGASAAQAESAAAGTIRRGFTRVRRRYISGWRGYDRTLAHPPDSLRGVSGNEWRALTGEYYVSANVLKASEDKTFAGAILASLTAPWGQAVLADSPGNTFYSGYREVWARDLYEAWTGLMTDGDRKTAGQALGFLLFRQQQPDGSFPRNSLINGLPAPDSSGSQLDECAYPLIMAYQLGWYSHRLYERHLRPEADFLIANGPSEGNERWEDQLGYSPSTISAEIAGLVAAAYIARKNHDYRSAAVWDAVANSWLRSIRSWTVTTNGPLSRHPCFIRLSKNGNADSGFAYNVGNGGPTLDQRAIVDQGFLELVRRGLLPLTNRTIEQSLPVVDKSIERHTRSGPGWLRFTDDGYGDAAGTGIPWVTGFAGTGHPWPVLTGERAEYELARGARKQAIRLLNTMRLTAWGVGLIPEQVWDRANLPASPYGTDPGTASIGFRNGKPDGSAGPLTWAEGQYVRLFTDIVHDRLVEQPRATVARYVSHRQGVTSLTVKSPADQANITNARIWVSGNSTRAARIYVAATNLDNNSVTHFFAARSGRAGHFALRITLLSGASVLNIAAIGSHDGTADAQRTLFFG
jgi:glucoamylase